MSVAAKKSFRICIVSEQLAGGGAERCSALLSQFFVAHNCSVHHVISIDKIAYEYAGEVLNLGKLKKDHFNIGDRIHRFRVMRNFFTTNTFDYIIDTRVVNRQFQEFFIAKYIYKAPAIKMIHSYMTELYFPKNKWLANQIYSHFYKLVTVSKAINDKVLEEYAYRQAETIYNPIDIDAIEKQSLEPIKESGKFILAVGRMTDRIKQFDVLIRSYAASHLPEKNIKLIFLGDGPIQAELHVLAQSLQLEDKILFEGTKSNPFPYFKNALFTVLTSKNEGFPTVLLESLACGTPVVAFDCQSGPSEIIVDRENGLLVDNQNQEKFIEAINEMVFNEKLYYHCKQNAKESVTKFSLEKIGNQWLQLLQNN